MFRKAIVVGLAMASLSGTVVRAGEGLGGPAGGGPIAGPHAYREIQIE